jgi:Bacteriophage tail sheath protein
MRPSAEIRPPGVYPSFVQPARAPLQVVATHVPGFLGLSQKGPIGSPVRVGSWDEFCDVFGYTADFYLSDSVESFFRNGGAAAWIVRIAHVPGEVGAQRGVDHAAAAERQVLDDWNKPTLLARALNEGKWGNSIWVGFKNTTGAKTLLTRDLDIGAGEAHVASTRGFEVGALVRIFHRDGEDFIIVSEVEEKVIRWAAATPVNRRHRAAAPTHLEVLSFEVHVALRDRREVFKNLQMHPSSRNYGPRVIQQQSRLICLDDLKSSSPPSHTLPRPQPMTKLAGGRDGTDTLTPEDFTGWDRGPGQRAGLQALVDADEAALLVAPDAMLFVERTPGPEGEMRAQRVQDALVDFCENHKDRFAVLDCPMTRDIEAVKRWRRRTDSSYAAYYWPWIEMPTQGGGTRRIPPSGIMAGMFALSEREDGVHQAPANRPIVGAVDLSLHVTEDDLGALNAESVNCFRMQRGIRPWGGRTASSDPDWRYINVRRLFIMMRRALEVGMAWMSFEPNDERTWATVRSLTNSFLSQLYQVGMFAGGKTEEAYYVKCDAELNTPDVVEKGQLICQIGVAPVLPAEYIMIEIVQNMGSEG